MKKKTTKSGSRAVELGVIGASLAGLAAAYFFLGPKGKKNQKQAKAWAIKMKGDVVEKLEMARRVSEPVYREIIDSVAAEYKKQERANRGEIDALARDIKKHWKNVSASARTVKHDAAKAAGRVVKMARS
jgi:uncharacterized protein with PIN domain